jgi:type IV secretory pathway TraG/TraD family ATPase VirD4
MIEYRPSDTPWFLVTNLDQRKGNMSQVRQLILPWCRTLIKPDEIRNAPANMIFTLTDQKPATPFHKMPYYEVLDEGRDFDRNPYL